MKQQRISIYFISTLMFMLFFCVSTKAQNDSIISNISDSLKIKLNYGLRIGGDLSKLIRSSFDDDYKGFEVNADYRLKKKLYIAGELGIEEKITNNDYMNITTSGSYIKGGIDYNMYQNWLDMDNMIYTGFRVGASSFSQNLNSFTVYTTNQYWEPQFSSQEPQEFKGLTAFWLELIIGIKAEILNNLYLGINVQLKGLINDTKPNNFENVYIPGFNKTFDSSLIGVGYGYTISYLIPLYKKDK